MENQEKRTYSAPELTQYGRLESITGNISCTGLGHKEYNGDSDDATYLGYWGSPMCTDVYP